MSSRSKTMYHRLAVEVLPIQTRNPWCGQSGKLQNHRMVDACHGHDELLHATRGAVCARGGPAPVERVGRQVGHKFPTPLRTSVGMCMPEVLCAVGRSAPHSRSLSRCDYPPTLLRPVVAVGTVRPMVAQSHVHRLVRLIPEIEGHVTSPRRAQDPEPYRRQRISRKRRCLGNGLRRSTAI